MGKRKRFTYIEILLILAIIAVLVVWLFPRLLKTLESDSATTGMITPYPGDALGGGGLHKPQIRYVNSATGCLSSFKVSGID